MAGQFSENAEHMDVKYIAHLARLYLTDEEAVRFQGQLDHILEHVRKLKEVDVSNVEPMSHAVPVQNVFRRDEILSGLDRAEVLANAPAQIQHQFRVPKIVE
ncbi:MAG: Asp-tRNA(Asn)/Glu-tRNA(Gln) amidotransferase subunit GatC [Kiritimatiellia bacterium]